MPVAVTFSTVVWPLLMVTDAGWLLIAAGWLIETTAVLEFALPPVLVTFTQ